MSKYYSSVVINICELIAFEFDIKQLRTVVNLSEGHGFDFEYSLFLPLCFSFICFFVKINLLSGDLYFRNFAIYFNAIGLIYLH